MSSKGRSNKERRELLVKHQRGKCFYCGIPMKLRRGFPNSATIEHCFPKSLGGTLNYFNIVVVCQLCNDKRGNSLDAPSPHPWDRDRQIFVDDRVI